MLILKYILRNIGRKKKQTFFSILCISVSSFIIFTSVSQRNGIENGLKKGINEVIAGELTACQSDKPNLNILESQLKEQEPFEWTEADRQQWMEVFPHTSVNRRIRLGALISFGDETSYVNFHALEPAHLDRIASMLTLLQGRMAAGEHEIVISETLAEELLCQVGDSLLLIADNRHGYMSDAIGVVSGIFQENGLAIFLNYNGFMPYALGKGIAEIPDDLCVELLINPESERDFSKREIALMQDYYGKIRPGLQLIPWEKTVPLMYSIVKVWHGGGMITQIVFILFSLIILVTLISLIIQARRKELSTLRAIGFSRIKIRILIASEYTFIAVFSILLSGVQWMVLSAFLPENGIPIGSEYMQAAFMTDRLLPVLYFSDFVYVLLLFILTTIVSSLISTKQLQVKNSY
jgi:ABC-type lipoprotein release transport system permease subunit